MPRRCATRQLSYDSWMLNRWWRVVGGLSMNLALGTLYGWSVFVAPLEAQFGWKRADGTRRFRRFYDEEGKGNGKSPMLAGIVVA